MERKEIRLIIFIVFLVSLVALIITISIKLSNGETVGAVSLDILDNVERKPYVREAPGPKAEGFTCNTTDTDESQIRTTLPCVTTPGSAALSGICDTDSQDLMYGRNALGICEITNCPIFGGGYDTSISGVKVPSLEVLQTPARLVCDTGVCKCDTGYCIHPEYNLCMSSDLTTTVDYGFAKGLFEWQCPYVLCNRWNEEESKWDKITDSECSKLCLPELYVGFESIDPTKSLKYQIEKLDTYRQFEVDEFDRDV
jgi:hypothetical protein